MTKRMVFLVWFYTALGEALIVLVIMQHGGVGNGRMWSWTLCSMEVWGMDGCGPGH